MTGFRTPGLSPAHGGPDFRAFKRGYLCYHEPSNQFYFRATLHNIIYGPRDRAVCNNKTPGPHHQPPGVDCQCGFYALSDRTAIAEARFSGATFIEILGSSVVLVVSLFGTVEEGSKGIRASHQRVEQVELDPRCAICPAPAVAVVPARTASSELFPGSRLTYRICDSRCENHILDDLPALAPAAVASSLGVETVWGSHLSLDTALYNYDPKPRGPRLLDLFGRQRRR